MTILTESSLDFAREHIQKYYDSDFYPKPIEFEALWYQWDEVKADLMSKNVAKLLVTPPKTMTIAKPKGGYRVVHQLEPIDTIIYSALACHVATQVEAARTPVASHIACSYRLSIANGSYFSGGSGWVDFIAKTEALAVTNSHVLVTDITDFYNQIYLHRLNNAIESADASLKTSADDIETFLSKLNSKSSQGVPVGPAASIVMAEAVLIDVDQFLSAQGVSHTRYVDDFRIFSNSSRELFQVLERLTLYLYENHRLTLSAEKTFVTLSAEFVQTHLHNNYVEEKANLMETLEIFNPYSEEYEEIQIPVDFFDEPEQKNIQLQAAIEKIRGYEHLDLGLARSVIRTARRNKNPVIARFLLENFDFFVPVVNDVILYLHEITDVVLSKEFLPIVVNLIESPSLDSQLVRFWFEWYVAHYSELMHSPKVHAFIYSGQNIENQALAAITTKNVAWVRDHKGSVFNSGGWSRRAILNASRILPSDERNSWLRLFIGNSPVILDRWVAKWVLETS